MFNHTIFETIEFAEVEYNNCRFTKGLKKSLEYKTFRQVMEILKKEKHCPVVRVDVKRSTNNWVKEIIVYGYHSSMWILFDKHTRRVKRIF